MARITIEIEGSAEDISTIVERAIARGPRPETPLAIEDERPVELLAMEPVQEHRKKRESLYEIIRNSTPGPNDVAEPIDKFSRELRQKIRGESLEGVSQGTKADEWTAIIAQEYIQAMSLDSRNIILHVWETPGHLITRREIAEILDRTEVQIQGSTASFTRLLKRITKKHNLVLKIPVQFDQETKSYWMDLDFARLLNDETFNTENRQQLSPETRNRIGTSRRSSQWELIRQQTTAQSQHETPADQ